MPVTLINTFVVPPEIEDEFVASWHSTIDHFRDAPGFIETRLHHNNGLRDTAYTYVNVARWDSVEAYFAAFEDFVPAGRRFPGVIAHPGLFEVVTEVTAPSPRELPPTSSTH